MNHPSSITLCEVGLRDGLQNEPTILTTDQKVGILRGLVDAGFKVKEALFSVDLNLRRVYNVGVISCKRRMHKEVPGGVC